MPIRPPMKSPGFLSNVASRLIAAASPPRNEADRMLPSSKGSETPQQLQTYTTDIFSYFTVSSNETQLLYSAENWVRIKLTLQTAGPVAVGTKQDIAPVLSGHGVLLDTDIPYEAFLAKGTRFYITSQTVNRVNVQIEPIPWLEQLDEDNVRVQGGVREMVRSSALAIVNAINTLRGAGAPTSSSGRTAAEMPSAAVPDGRRMIPRLTGVPGPRKMR